MAKTDESFECLIADVVDRCQSGLLRNHVIEHETGCMLDRAKKIMNGSALHKDLFREAENLFDDSIFEYCLE